MTYRTFIASVLVAALAVTSWTAAPARAGSDDFAKIVAGVAALAIIGAAIADRNDNDDYRGITRNQRYHDPYYRENPRGHRFDRKHRRDRFRSRLRPLPHHCRRGGRTFDGYIEGYGRRCLFNNYSQFNALPHECATRVRARNGRTRIIYPDYCLNRRGLATAGRR